MSGTPTTVMEVLAMIHGWLDALSLIEYMQAFIIILIAINLTLRLFSRNG